ALRQLAKRHRTTFGPARDALVGEPEQEALGDPLLPLAEEAVRMLAEPGDRAAHATGPGVRLAREATALTPLPERQQRRREQRQRARGAVHVADQRRGEARLEIAPG